MKKTEPEVKLHPRLWQIADMETYKDLFDIKERLGEHVAAITEQLEQFYASTGTDEDFFEDNPGPNISTQVYSKWVELKHLWRFQWPNYEHADGYINLTLKINDMLSTHDFDHCLKYFEKRLEELTEKLGESQGICAMADAIAQFQLEKHKKFRGKGNSPITAQDKKRIVEYMSEFLKEDHGWSDKDAAVVLKEAKV